MHGKLPLKLNEASGLDQKLPFYHPGHCSDPPLVSWDGGNLGKINIKVLKLDFKTKLNQQFFTH